MNIAFVYVLRCMSTNWTLIEFKTKWKRRAKHTVCLWTCALPRAIHLELVPSLTVSTFLQAFGRFAARRGLPARILPDNAKTFKCAAQEFKRIARAKEIQQYLMNKGVTWEFIIEKAPWQGRFWERIVGSSTKCELFQLISKLR